MLFILGLQGSLMKMCWPWCTFPGQPINNEIVKAAPWLFFVQRGARLVCFACLNYIGILGRFAAPPGVAFCINFLLCLSHLACTFSTTSLLWWEIWLHILVPCENLFISECIMCVHKRTWRFLLYLPLKLLGSCDGNAFSGSELLFNYTCFAVKMEEGVEKLQWNFLVRWMDFKNKWRQKRNEEINFM